MEGGRQIERDGDCRAERDGGRRAETDGRRRAEVDGGEEEEDKRRMGDGYRNASHSYLHSQSQSHFALYILSYYSLHRASCI